VSESSQILGSSGIFPKNGTPNYSAIFSPQPALEMLISVPHSGQTKPLMFSTSVRGTTSGLKKACRGSSAPLGFLAMIRNKYSLSLKGFEDNGAAIWLDS
jgi:hypothetical protein